MKMTTIVVLISSIFFLIGATLAYFYMNIYTQGIMVSSIVVGMLQYRKCAEIEKIENKDRSIKENMAAVMSSDDIKEAAGYVARDLPDKDFTTNEQEKSS